MPNDELAPHTTDAGAHSSSIDVFPVPLTDAAIDTVVAELNAIHRATSFACARQVGQLLLDRFYGGDLTAWRSRAEKDASFRKLKARADSGALHISAATLYRSVALVELESRVGTLDRDGLTFTHAREVFGLPAAEQARLITAAATEGWTVDRMESEAGQVRAAAKRSAGGRPADPRFVKAIRRIEKLLAPEDGWFDDVDKVATLDAEEMEALRKTVAAMKARCEELEARLLPAV